MPAEEDVLFPSTSSLLHTHEYFVFSKLQLLQSDHVFAVDCCLQGGLVHKIFQVSAGEAHRASGNNIGLNSCRYDTQCQQRCPRGIKTGSVRSVAKQSTHSACDVILKKHRCSVFVCSAQVFIASKTSVLNTTLFNHQHTWIYFDLL